MERKEEYQKAWEEKIASKKEKYGEKPVTKMTDGEKPKFKVGDNLAFYEFFHDYEGEVFLGKVKSVELDKESDDWTYEFEDGDSCTERSLIDDATYIKREKKIVLWQKNIFSAGLKRRKFPLILTGCSRTS